MLHVLRSVGSPKAAPKFLRKYQFRGLVMKQKAEKASGGWVAGRAPRLVSSAHEPGPEEQGACEETGLEQDSLVAESRS